MYRAEGIAEGDVDQALTNRDGQDQRGLPIGGLLGGWLIERTSIGLVLDGEVARRMGMTNAASRAVGLANGRNPVSIIVPCHRVVGSSGALTGYAGGLDRKTSLLRIEAQRARSHRAARPLELH